MTLRGTRLPSGPSSPWFDIDVNAYFSILPQEQSVYCPHPDSKPPGVPHATNLNRFRNMTEDRFTIPLFDDEPQSEHMAQAAPAPQGLEFVKSPGRPLSKAQAAFNQLTQRIEKLRQDIVEKRDSLEGLLVLHNESLQPQLETFSRRQYSMAKLLADSTRTIKYGKRQRESVGTVIVELCDEVFDVLPPDDAACAFYAAWSGEEIMDPAEEFEETKRAVRDEAWDEFGIDVDLSDIEDGPDADMRMAERMMRELHEQQRLRAEKRARKQRTPKQEEREAKRRQAEAEKVRSIRKIYLSLVKALHPDGTLDVEEAARRETLLKRVTAAYRELDLLALLEMEM
jgi:hypothetical protein